MSEEIRVVKSPVHMGIERLPASSVVPMIVSVMLPSGIVITNSEQFEDNETEDVEVYSEDIRSG